MSNKGVGIFNLTLVFMRPTHLHTLGTVVHPYLNPGMKDTPLHRQSHNVVLHLDNQEAVQLNLLMNTDHNMLAIALVHLTLQGINIHNIH